jgi:cation:H+ antiporter
MVTALLLIGGMLALTLGAEFLVRGAVRLAALLCISPLVIGLTVVAFGTSAPEFAVSLAAALEGKADIALGNVVGSNIFNILAILGVSAIAAPLAVNAKLIKIDVPVMIAASLLLWGFAADGRWSRPEGLFAFCGLVAYSGFLIVSGRAGLVPNLASAPEAETAPVRGDPLRNPFVRTLEALFLVVAGLSLLVLGSNWFVNGAVQLARLLGVSELVIGLTIVAGGTSLPELATSVTAALRGERDISVGNIVGSNIFNILCVLGLSSAVSARGVVVSPEALAFDIPVMVAVAVVCLPMFFTGRSIARWEGLLLVMYYVAYMTVLVLHSLGNAWLAPVTFSLAWFALPLSFLILILSFVREWQVRIQPLPAMAPPNPPMGQGTAEYKEIPERV